MDFSSYKTGVEEQNATLRRGHTLQAVLALGGFISTLHAEHPVQGVEKTIQELNATESAEASGKLASSETLKGKQQRTDIENAEGTADSENPLQAGSHDQPGTSLKSLGLDDQTSVYLFVDVRKNPEDTPESYNVGQVMKKYEANLAKGDPYNAIRDVLVGPVETFQAKYPQMTLDGIVCNVLFAIPNVKHAALHHLPK